jgi:hypothetical protein
MLLFADGFETFSPYDLWRKWGYFSFDGINNGSGTIPASIVHGPDTTFTPAKAYATRPEGRAIQGMSYTLMTPIKPSRTVFTGFAFRKASVGGTVLITVEFVKGVSYNKATPPTIGVGYISDLGYAGGALVATCTLSISASYIDVTWTFVGTSPLTQTGRINSTANLLNGDWRYIQAGMTLMGNVVAQPQAWAEVRLGSRGGANNLLKSSIMTGPESGVNVSYLIDAVRIHSGLSWYSMYQSANVGMDDVYICNDEGEFNNTFLGNIKIRCVAVSGDGSENNSVPFADTYRFRTVDEDFIDTVNALPSPIPDPETTPLFIPWEPFAGNYFTLEEHGDRQLMRYNSLNALGTYSKIYGAILHTLLQPLFLDTPQAPLTAVRKLGFELIESKPMDAPLIKRAQFEARHFVWENEETIEPGEQYLRWSASAVDASEWGLELTPVIIEPETYDPAIVRISLTIYDTVSEELAFLDFTHRYFEEFVDDRFDAAADPTLEYVWAFYESLVFESLTEGNRGVNRFLNETLEFSEYLPYTVLFAGEFVGFADEIFVQYIDLIDELLDAADWADGFWEELFTDTLEATDETAIAFLMALEETFGLEEPYLWDNHELIEDEFAIDADEPWDNHELLEEYLYPDDEVVQGVGLIAEDEFSIAEDPHDGFWVELFGDYTLFADYVYTQHWRYETMFGMVVNSWQVAPVEQTGNDGDHTGDNPWGS